MTQKLYKREWLAMEVISAALRQGTLVSYWRNLRGETVVLLKKV